MYMYSPQDYLYLRVTPLPCDVQMPNPLRLLHALSDT